MSFVALDKIRGLFGRNGSLDADYEPARAEYSQPEPADPLADRVEAMALELEQLRAAHRDLEARYLEPAEPLGLSVDATPGANAARVEQAIASLNMKCVELSTAQAAMAAALRRAHDAMHVIEAERTDQAERLKTVEASAARDRIRSDDATAAVRELRAAVATATSQIAATRTDIHSRADEVGRRVAARLGPLYLMGLLALLVSLGALGFVLMRS